MVKIPTMMLHMESTFLNSHAYRWFYEIHAVISEQDKRISSPRHFIKLINSFKNIFNKKRTKINERQKHLKNGVSKLNESKKTVNELEVKAKIQREKLSSKQAEADKALFDITQSMQGAGEQKQEMEELKVKIEAENKILAKRKAEIELELKEVC